MTETKCGCQKQSIHLEAFLCSWAFQQFSFLLFFRGEDPSTNRTCKWVSEWVSESGKSFNLLKYLTYASNPITSFTKLVQGSILNKSWHLWPNSRQMIQLETNDPTRDQWPNSRPMSQLKTYDPTWDIWPNSRPMTQLETYDPTRDLWPNSRPMTQLGS